jgi:hypothetical protein
MDREKRFSNKRNTQTSWLANAERGQGLVEYALGLVLVGMVASASLVAVGPAISEAFCEAIEALNPTLTNECGGSGITIMFAKYNAGKSELDVQAKAPPDCDYDLQVGYEGEIVGTMVRQGESFVFKHTETLFPAPTSVEVGHPECGWATVPLE